MTKTRREEAEVRAMTSSDTDRTAVESTVRDYFEGWFEGSPERMEAALHPALVKRAPQDDASGIESAQTAEEMIAMTREGRGKRFTPEQRRFDIEIVDIHRGIASVVVRSVVYREYLHLAFVGGRWQIVHAFWTWTGDPH